MYENFPFLKQAGILIHFFNLFIVTELLFWNRKERSTVKQDRQLGMYFLSQLGF